ncbi:MAG TPA: MFS transporter, partial [Candidatus Avibacteroides faecavium]|nr:MFS transporter [Candidatus Avibacteroides faecavium]
MEKVKEGRLLSRDFCLLAVANSLMFFSFYALMPLLPFYLGDVFGVNYSMAGAILASYSVACIVVRPIAGYLLDAFRQRPLYLLGYCAFAALFCGYAFAAALGVFVVFRIMHGLAFGLTSVSGNTIASEIVPRGRMGEGLGIYGLSNTLAM